MSFWAVVAEWVKGGNAVSPQRETAAKSFEGAGQRSESRLTKPLSERHQSCDDFLGEDTSQTDEEIEEEVRYMPVSALSILACARDCYKENLRRSLRLGHEISLEDEDMDETNARRWTVTYKTGPLRSRELNANTLQEELVSISWMSEHKGDTASVSYNYHTRQGHNANWMISGSGGHVSIRSKGEISESDFVQENNVTFRNDVRSHPVETDIQGAIRINYLTDNVDFQWKGAVSYPVMKSAVKISHGMERQELLGCCWTLKAEKSSEELPWRSVRMETAGQVAAATTGIENVRAELIRNLKGPYDLEFEAKTPLTRRGTKWVSGLKRKNDEGTEFVTFVEGEDIRFRSWNTRFNCEPVKNTRVALSGGYWTDNGWNLATEVKLGQQDLNEMDRDWNLKAGLKVAQGRSLTQADIDLFIPLNFPVSL